MFVRPWLTLAFFLALSASMGFLLTTPEPAHAETAGVIYIADLGGVGGAVIRVDPSQPAASNQTVVSSGQNFGDPFDIVLAADGKLYVVDRICCGGNGGVIRVDPSKPANNNQTLISSGQNFSDPTDIALAADGKLYVADRSCCGGFSQGGVIRVDPSQPANNNQTVISSVQDFSAPTGLALAADGKLYVVDRECCNGGNSGVIRVDPGQPADNNQTIVSQGQNFVDPSGIALAAGGKLYVADTDCCGNSNGALIRVDPSQPASSNQTVISSGQSFFNPLQPAVVPGVSIANATVTEGNGTSVNANFAVTLAPWSPLSITVPFTPVSGSATVNVDFDGTPGSVTFSPGQTSKTATVSVWGDGSDEPTETYSVTLQPPAGVGLVDGTATGTILDNDATATLWIGNPTVTEGNNGTKTANFTVTMSPASGQVVSVQYATVDGTAQASGGGVKRDYEPASGTLTFQPGQTSKPIPVTVNGDIVDEPNETFTVTLSNPTGGAALGDGQGTGTITDDDAPMPCSPRPKVTVTQTAANGKLQVHVASSPFNNQQPNALQQLKFGAFQNAKVTFNGQQVSSNQSVSVPANATAADFIVERVTAGQPTTVPLTVVDGCGDWKTFVGGGVGAGF
jgi:hypothetical protein